MRRALVYFADRLAGILVEDEEGYHFIYNAEYISDNNAVAISKTLPRQSDAYHSKVLFAFFDGLIPEGWLLDLVSNTWKVNREDRMGLLLSCCQETIGAVRVLTEEEFL